MKKILFFIIIVAIGGTWYHYHTKNQNQVLGTTDGESPTQNEVHFYAINGLEVSEEIAHRRPIAVMVENHPDSRPQSGLDKADIVYETVAEGGITRFLAIYQTADEANIGPIRSARPYYLSLAAMYDPLYVHVGGSDEALSEINANKFAATDDLNEFYNGNYFQRIKSRTAPHNTYSQLTTLRKFLDNKKLTQTLTAKPEWQFFAADQIPQGTPADTVTINFSLPDYTVKYRYDPDNQRYVRYVAGTPHKQADTNTALTAETVLVQSVIITPIPKDPKLRVIVNLEGTGTLHAFMDGQMIEGTWKKQNGQPIQYFDNNNQSLKIKPGKIWVELVSDDDPARISWSSQVTKN